MTRAKIEKQILETNLFVETSHGLKIGNPATLTVSATEIEFTKSPFHLKDEIKAMTGARWHGFDQDNPRKVWTAHNCPRNWFQLKYLMGQNPYEWFDRELINYEYPDHLPLMNHQKLMADTGLTYHFQVWAATMGVGKLQRLTTPILTPTGWTTMGQLKVGDRLIDPDGGVCKVLSLHPQGKKEVFKVTFTDGSSTDCGKEHLWRVITPTKKWKGQEWEVLETQELVARGLQYSNGNNKWFIPMVEPVQFNKQELLCHPYVMGYLLGNGCMSLKRVSIPDKETVDRLNTLMSQPLEPLPATLRGEKIDYYIRCPHVRDAIDTYQLSECRSNSKFVPSKFLFNTSANRLALLQGLLDSDGTPLHSAGVELCSASDQLASDVVFLIQSFGGTCHRGLKEFPTYTYKGEALVGQPSHRIHGSFNSQVRPFLLSRKSDKYTVPTKYEPTRAIVSVESVGFDECICIKVDSDTRCYVTDEFIVTHNTLSAQAVIEMSGVPTWFWVGPKQSLENIERELEKWKFPLTWTKPKDGRLLVESVRDNKFNMYLTTYERLVKYMETRSINDPLPHGVIFDESSRLKSPTAQRSKASQDLADMMRAEYGNDCYVILMSGTPSPKQPIGWWKQCEIAYPGFLKEGSQSQLEARLAFMVNQNIPGDAGIVKVRVGWKDNEDKCEGCGELSSDDSHQFDESDPFKNICQFTSSKNEVSYMYERLSGLVTVIHQKDVLQLPDKVYEIDRCEPSPSTLRVAKTLVKAAPNIMTGLTWLRELSDGFIYKNVPDGVKQCPTCAESEESGKIKSWFDPDNPDEVIQAIDMLDKAYTDLLKERYIECPRCHGKQQVKKVQRVAHSVPCPKEQKLKNRLEQCHETGRIIIFAGFQGSIDRIKNICIKRGWDVVRVDGRGWEVTQKNGNVVKTDKPLSYWSDMETNQNVAFVSHPKSGGLSLNLTESRMVVYWSNDFDAEARSQSECRAHRKGMDENRGCKIVDFYHLPSDENTHNILKANRKLELATLGEVAGDLDD